MDADKIVASARAWVGTPFKHQGRNKGQAVDCIGMVIGVARELGMTVTDVKGYGRIPSMGKLQNGLEAHLTKVLIADMRPGDVLLMRFSKDPQHVAIFTGSGIIHAYEKIGGCVEHTLNNAWKNRIVAVYRMVK